MTAPACELCDDCGWICENHPDRHAMGERACECGGAGSPCPLCNRPGESEALRLPKGFKTMIKRGWRH